MARRKGTYMGPGGILLLLLIPSSVTRLYMAWVYVSPILPGMEIDMFSTIPEIYGMSILYVVGFVSVISCLGVYIWRYAEHNAAYGLDRKTNKIGNPKFIGALILAMIMTVLTSYYMSGTLVNCFGIPDPVAWDYYIMGALSAVLLGISYTILFSEGVGGLAKFIAQKVKEASDGAEDLLKELQAAKAELARMRKVEVDEEVEDPNQDVN